MHFINSKYHDLDSWKVQYRFHLYFQSFVILIFVEAFLISGEALHVTNIFGAVH